jgi:antibiotic biosynthesis monooxygenase (ABM) superfamily enzyme
MRKNKYLWLTASKSKPGKDEEYNRWYDQHVTTFFKFPGLKRVSRNRCINTFEFGDKCAQYVVVYEFDNKEALEAFGKSEAAKIAKKEYEDGWAEIGETLWTGWWELLKTLERD